MSEPVNRKLRCDQCGVIKFYCLKKKIGDKNVCHKESCTLRQVCKPPCYVQLVHIAYERKGINRTLKTGTQMQTKGS